MWNVNPGNDQSRGGFQNRDVGKTSFDRDFGPDYGIDYARFSDTPDIAKDLALKGKIEEALPPEDRYIDRGILVRNGFVILKGKTSSEQERTAVAEIVKSFLEVIEVINQIVVIQ